MIDKKHKESAKQERKKTPPPSFDEMIGSVDEQELKKKSQENKKIRKPIKDLEKLDKQIEQKEENYDEYRIKKDMDKMEQTGFFENLEDYDKTAKRLDLLEEHEVFVKDEKGIKTGKVNNIRLARAIMSLGYHLKRIYDEKTGQDEIIFYKSGYYHLGGEEIVRGETDELLGDKATDHRRTEALKHVRYKLGNRLDRNKLEPDVKYINCNNGIYNIETEKLIPHSPEFYFINKLPINYKKDAKCPKIGKFFSEVLYSEDIPLIEEIGGDILHREKTQHVAFVFLGGGRNGKGVMVNLFSEMLGTENYSTRNLQEFLSDRFAKGDLYGKMANFGSEVSSKYIDDSADLKHITGGEPITGERKYKGTFPFNPYSTMIFNANQLPPHKDKTFAFYQRWIIIPFPYTFARGDEKTNPNLLKELTTPDELSGLLNLWIKGLKRLMKKNNFSYVDNDEIPKYEKYAYPEYNYIETYLENVSDIFLPTDEVYNNYCNWAKENKFQIQTKTTFTRKIKSKLNDPKVETGAKKVHGVSKRCYINVNWKIDKNGKEKKLDEYNLDKKNIKDDLKHLVEWLKKLPNSTFESKHGFWSDDPEMPFSVDTINDARDRGIVEYNQYSIGIKDDNYDLDKQSVTPLQQEEKDER